MTRPPTGLSTGLSTGLFAGLLLSFTLPLGAQDDGKGQAADASHAGDAVAWHTDFAKAKEIAKKEKKDLLIDFTGSDWCGWCVRLKKEVFDTDEFQAEVGKHYVLVELDYPRKKELSPDLVAQNEKLKSEYGISGYPTIYVTDANGRPYHKTGYRPKGPGPYLEHLAEARSEWAATNALFTAAEKKKGAEKAKALDGALSKLTPELMPFYSAQIQAVIAADANDKAGLKSKYVAVLRELDAKKAMGVVMQELNPLFRSKDWAAAGEKLDAFITTWGRSGETAQTALFYRGVAHANAGEFSDAIELLEAAKAAAPESKMVNRLNQQITAVRKKMDAESEGAEEEEEK